jgi:hypothetical protein
MKTIDELYRRLREIGLEKSVHGPGMSRPAYAKLEQEELKLRAELLERLDGGESPAA